MVYAASPVLCRDDGPVGRAQCWYRQFFPDWQPARKPYAASDETNTVDRSRNLMALQLAGCRHLWPLGRQIVEDAVEREAATSDRWFVAPGQPWKGGSDELETFHREPAGSTPARQRRSPPAGSECCMVGGDVHREAYTAGGEATYIEPRNSQCWCLHRQTSGGSTGSAVKDEARRTGRGPGNDRRATGWLAREPGRPEHVRVRHKPVGMDRL